VKSIDPSYAWNERNSELGFSTNKEAISNATMNLMESSILAYDEC